MGVGVGLLEGGDGAGNGLVAGPEAFRVEYVHSAAQALLRFGRIYGVSLRISGPSISVSTMGQRPRANRQGAGISH
jgi:hypothetical protein